MSKKNFLQSLIQRFSPDVFRPVPEGLLYVMLQSLQREIGGECPWDTGDGCQKGYTSYWLGPRCRNNICPGYLHPVGLVSYTSRSSATSSMDNRFDYSSMRFNVGEEQTLTGIATGGSTTTLIDTRRQFILEGVTPGSVIENLTDIGTSKVWQVTATTLTFVAPLTNGNFSGGGDSYRIRIPKNDWFNVGTLGAMIRIGFNEADVGGFGAGYYGTGYYGNNSVIATPMNIHIGDKYYISCIANTGYVGPAIPDPSNQGSYGPTVTAGYYRGDHNTVYTVELIDFWGYVQNFEDSLLQICLGTADGEWLDFWGTYFGIERLYLMNGYEDDDSYKTRILKEVTRAKGTKPVILEEAIKYFKSDLVTIAEYHQSGSRVLGTNGNTWACIKGHTATAADRPIIGANYATYWRRDYGWAPVWVIGSSYSPIQNDGAVPYNTLDPASGLWPYQFYIYPPYSTVPSAKFIKTGSNLIVVGTGYVWAYEAGSYGYGHGGGGYGYGGFCELIDIAGGGIGDYLFLVPIAVGNICLFGYPEKFSGLKLSFTTPGVAGTYTWQYWNGSWSTLPVSDTTSGFTIADPIYTASVLSGGTGYKVNDVLTVDGGTGGTVKVIKIHPSLVDGEGPVFEISVPNWPSGGIELLSGGSGYSVGTKTTTGGSGAGCTISIISLAAGYVNWKLPTDWATANDNPYNIPDTGEQRYWVRVRADVPPTTPPIAKYIGLTFAGQTCRGCYVGHSGTYPDPATTPSRDKNNCYIYYLDSFVKPKWQSGFQDIVDKIKTAGTICIVNQR